MKWTSGSIDRPAQAISAKKFLYKLCGSSQPSIVEGSDGNFYVLKFFVAGQQGLINEVVGAELIQRMGLPSPRWARVEITEEFIERNPGMWFSKERGSIRPCAGFHFASQLIEAPGEQRTYQMIPHGWIDRIENREDFLGILVLDLWANNCDRRQAIFTCDENCLLRVSFIDNDSMFGGAFGFETTCPRRAMVYDLDVYRGFWNRKAVREWMERIEGISEAEIAEIISGVPAEWASARVRAEVMDQLRRRRGVLPHLLDDSENVLNSSYSIKYHRARHATEPGQICNAPVFPRTYRARNPTAAD